MTQPGSRLTPAAIAVHFKAAVNIFLRFFFDDEAFFSIIFNLLCKAPKSGFPFGAGMRNNRHAADFKR